MFGGETGSPDHVYPAIRSGFEMPHSHHDGDAAVDQEQCRGVGSTEAGWSNIVHIKVGG
jgi:hypothetical protein